MKKIILIILIILIAWMIDSAIYDADLDRDGIAHAAEIDMNRIMQIESGGNAMAYNKYSQARGLYQITPVCLKDFNQVNKTAYKVDDLFDPQINARIAYWYMNTRIPSLFKGLGIADTVDNRLHAYNAGLRALKQGIKPKETRDYIKKYHKGGI